MNDEEHGMVMSAQTIIWRGDMILGTMPTSASSKTSAKSFQILAYVGFGEIIKLNRGFMLGKY